MNLSFADMLVWATLVFAFLGAINFVVAPLFLDSHDEADATQDLERSHARFRRWYRRTGILSLAVAALCLGLYVGLQVTGIGSPRGRTPGVRETAIEGKLDEISRLLKARGPEQPPPSEALTRIEQSQAEILSQLASRDRPVVVTAPEGSRNIVIAPPTSGWDWLVASIGFACVGFGFFLWFGGFSSAKGKKPDSVEAS